MKSILIPSFGVAFGVALAILSLAGPTHAQDEAAPAPTLSIEEVIVEPEKPAADTLCQLRIKVKNPGAEVASQFGFGVKLNGQDLGIYGNQLFMFPIEPGATGELKLYNFWTTETSRPDLPKDGKLTVEVTLKEAQWMKIENDEEGVEVWTPLGAVSGLPVSNSVTLATAGGSAG
jgi:hypothetical protein